MMRENIIIIALNGSPKREGNTATLMRWVLEGCIQEGAQVEWINLVDQDVSFCRGCHSCLLTNECAIQDDLLVIFNKLEKADGIIVGSPVYSGQATAILKTLQDRLTLLKLFTGILSSAKTIGVTTSGIAPTKKLGKNLANFFGRKVGIVGIKCASLKSGYQNINDVCSEKDRKKAKKLGMKLMNSIKKQKKTRSLIYSWINFLRKHLLSRMIRNNPEQFRGVLSTWREKGWLKNG
jgi:multimeric flavodoxin WrbA